MIFTASILAAVFNLVYLVLFSAAVYLIYTHEINGSMLAMAIGVLSIISLLTGIGFNDFTISINLVFIGLSYLEYKRVGKIELLWP